MGDSEELLWSCFFKSIPSPKSVNLKGLREVRRVVVYHNDNSTPPGSPRDIVALLQCFQSAVPRTTLRQCSRIVAALLVLTGRVTMLGLSRWAGPGGSYRTVQRFFSQALPWARRFWVFFRQPLSRADEVYLLVGAEIVGTKAGTHPHGLDRFLSSLSGTPVPRPAL